MIDPHIDDHAPVSTSTSTCGSSPGCASSSSVAWPAGNTSGGTTSVWHCSLPGWQWYSAVGPGLAAWHPARLRDGHGPHHADRYGGLARPAGRAVFGLFTPVGLFFKLMAATPSPAGMPRSRRVTGSPSRAPPTYAATCVSPNLWRSR